MKKERKGERERKEGREEREEGKERKKGEGRQAFCCSQFPRGRGMPICSVPHRDIPGLVRRNKGRRELWVRALVMVSAGRGKARKAALGLAYLVISAGSGVIRAGV